MTFTRVALAGAIALGLGFVGAAQAQTIPTPVNPTPNFPVATDGSPLPAYSNGRPEGLFTGRSVFAPVGAVVGSGVGLADTAVGTGLGAAGTVVDGTVGQVVR